VEKEYNSVAAKQKVTPEQHAIGLATVRRAYGKTMAQARQFHTQLLSEGHSWLDRGNSVETLSPDITRHLPPRSLEGLKRQQDINDGLRPQITDFATILWLGGLPPASFSQRVVLEDRPYLSLSGRRLVEGINTSLNDSDTMQQYQAQACLSVVSKINQAAVAGGAALRDPALLDRLYVHGFRRLPDLLKQYGSLTDAQVWGVVSPVIMEHVKNRVRMGDDLNPDLDTVSFGILSTKTGIPADMVLPTWNSLIAQPHPDLSLDGLANHYRQDPTAILSKALGYPYEALHPVVSGLTASGVSPSLAKVLPKWEEQAHLMPSHWF
jgi:hypothetical protein